MQHLSLVDRAFSAASTITRLDLEASTSLGLAGITLLAKSLPALQSLTLPYSCQVCLGDTFPLALAHLPKLSHLKLKTCVAGSGGFIKHLTALTSLTQLDMEDGGTVLVGVSVITALTNLKSLTVSEMV